MGGETAVFAEARNQALTGAEPERYCVAMQCPICDATRGPSALHCACGYQFETADTSLAVQKLGEHRGTARKLTRSGAQILLSVSLMLPGLLIGGLSSYAAIGLIPAAVLAGIGGVRLVRGARGWSRARRGLHAAKTLRQLPPARVV